MDFLNIFSKSARQNPKLSRLPRGSFIIDAHGEIRTSTIPQSFSAAQLRDIGKRVLTAFQTAREARMPLREIVVHYKTLRITARELRSGAIVFLSPKTSETSSAQP